MANDTSVMRMDEAGLRKLLMDNSKRLAAVLARDGVPLQRVQASIMLACNKNPDLYECDPSSLIQASVQALRMGLDPSGTLGSAYLVPYRDRQRGVVIAQMIPGYRGLIDLATSCGAVRMVEVEVIYEADEYQIEYGLQPIFRHKPNYTTTDPGNPVLYYCILTLPSGDRRPTVMTASEVNAVRDRTPPKKSSPWVTDYNEMAKKTVLRRALKTVALNPDRHIPLAHALADDDARDAGQWQAKPVDDLFVGQVLPAVSRSEILADRLQPAAPALPPPTESELDWIAVFLDNKWTRDAALVEIRKHNPESPGYAKALTALAERGPKS